MSIWKTVPDIESLNTQQRGTINETLGIKFECFDGSTLTASMPVDERTKQPFGLLHGGASVVLAETLGSVASYLCIDRSKYFCVGMEVNANHLAAVRSGLVTGVVSAIQLGKTIHVWDIRIFDEQGKPTCVSRLTVAVIEQKES